MTKTWLKNEPIIIAGWVIDSPQTRYDGDAIIEAQFKLKRRFGDEIICLCFGGLAKIAAEYLRHNRLVACEGRANGAGDLIVDNLQLLDNNGAQT